MTVEASCASTVGMAEFGTLTPFRPATIQTLPRTRSDRKWRAATPTGPNAVPASTPNAFATAVAEAVAGRAYPIARRRPDPATVAQRCWWRRSPAPSTTRPNGLSPQDVADAILLLGPGFVLLKALALTGGQPQRLQWEWVVWSVLPSVPVAAATTWLMPQLAQLLGSAGLLEWEPAARFLVAVIAGVGLGLLWITVRRARRPWLRGIYRSVIDSAWDLALDDATRPAPDGGNYGVEVTVDTGAGEAIYFGGLGAFGYERVKAEPWLYLTYTQRWEGENVASSRCLGPRACSFTGSKSSGSESFNPFALAHLRGVHRTTIWTTRSEQAHRRRARSPLPPA